MTTRYFLSPPVGGENANLEGPEAHHLIHVMRAKPGMEIVVFDGTGVEFRARVERIGRTTVGLAILSRKEIDRELAANVTLGVPLPKGDRQRWLVEKAVELGVFRIVPLRTVRSVALPTQKTLDRLRRTVIEASKQCGRNRLMAIVPPRGWSDFVRQSGQPDCRLLAHPHRAAASGEEAQRPPRPIHVGWPAEKLPCEVRLAVGPEGGFTQQEVALAIDAGWQPVDLGPRILRIETAALLLTAMVVQPMLS